MKERGFGLDKESEKYIIREIINNIKYSGFYKVIEDSIRPITFCDNGYYWIFGTGFFILYGEDLYFLTARHNFIRKDLFINESFDDVQKKIDSFFIIRNLIKGIDLKDPENIIKEEIHNIFFHPVLPKNERLEQIGLGSEDLNDIAIITFNKAFANKFILNKKLINLDTNGLRVKKDMGKSAENNDIVFVAGYCLDNRSENEVVPVDFDDENNVIKSEMNLNRNYLFGKVVENTTSFIKRVEIFFDNDFISYNGFSGSPVFLYKDEKIYFTGLVIRGGNKQIYFISIDFLRFYLMSTDIGSINNKFFINDKEVLNSCYEKIKFSKKNDIKIIEVENQQMIIEVNKEEFSISCEYLCDVISLEILLNNISFFNKENFAFIRDFCYNLVSDKDKISLKKHLINLDKNILKKLKSIYYENMKNGHKIDLSEVFKSKDK
jgi:hypothetical protein